MGDDARRSTTGLEKGDTSELRSSFPSRPVPSRPVPSHKVRMDCVDVKQHLKKLKLCESRGGLLGSPSLIIRTDSVVVKQH